MTDKNLSNQILVVDDDQEICLLLQEYLQKHCLDVLVANNGIEMFEAIRANNVDLIVLDVMMPGADGFELCREIRKDSKMPIIMLTAGSDETDRIIGLELGADDYMVKPFNPRELLARIKAVLRRAEPHELVHSNASSLRFGTWSLNTATRILSGDEGQICPLNGAEFELLSLFLNKPSHVFSRDELCNHLKGRDSFPFDRSIDVQISRLRQRLGDDGKTPQLIKTVRGSGYILTAQVEPQV